MKSLSHTTKVAVRRALKALQFTDSQILHGDDRRDRVQQTATKAGFDSRTALEAFAIKHKLMVDPQSSAKYQQRQLGMDDHVDQGERATFPPYDC